MNSGELKKAKRDVRRRVLALRDQLGPGERASLGSRALDRFLGLPQVSGARIVMTFWSFGSEIATGPMIQTLAQSDLQVALPSIQGQDLEPRLWAPGLPTTPTAFGAREPSADAGGAIDPATIDVVVVPAIAYDRQGRRVGYGGGYYDRFLPMTRRDALRVGFGFDLQLVDGDLPSGAFDTRIDLVVTSSEIVECRPG